MVHDLQFTDHISRFTVHYLHSRFTIRRERESEGEGGREGGKEREKEREREKGIERMTQAQGREGGEGELGGTEI